MNYLEENREVVENDTDNVDSSNKVTPLDREDMVRIMRLILEALEVALHLCNTFLTKFGPLRLMDILEQIFPTAYIVNTSYWPLYRTETEQSICVCNVFNIYCQHIKDGLSYVDLDLPISELASFKDGAGKVTLVDLDISISRKIVKKRYLKLVGPICYKFQKEYEIQLEFRPKICLEDAVDEYGGPVTCILRFQLVKPKIPFNRFCLWLTPHPLLNPLYGLYFSCLADNVPISSYPNSLIVTWDQCPKHTIKILDKRLSRVNEYLILKDVGQENKANDSAENTCST